MTSPIVQFKSFWSEVPREVQKFLIRALVIFLVWKFAYHLVLKPTRVIDRPLTHVTTVITIKVLEVLYPKSFFSIQEKLPIRVNEFYSCQIYSNSERILGIVDPCNGLELFILYIGFIFCLPKEIFKMIFYCLLGLLVLFIMNTLRCTFIAYLNINSSIYTDIAHHYIFKLIIYITIFFGWVIYTKNNNSNANN